MQIGGLVFRGPVIAMVMAEPGPNSIQKLVQRGRWPPAKSIITVKAECAGLSRGLVPIILDRWAAIGRAHLGLAERKT